MTDHDHRAGTDRTQRFLAGDSQSAVLIRHTDWQRTSVGPIETWPASLKAIVGMLLHSHHPMFLWWGPDLVQFYNDAYIPSFGVGKHPRAMGQRGADCWQEVWPIISPQIDDVMRRAIATWHEDHLVPILRNDQLEEVYWTYGYSPVFDDDGSVGGTLVVCTETTARVVGERRLRALRALSDRTALATDAPAVLSAAIDTFAQMASDVPFACLYGDESAPRLLATAGLDQEALVAQVDAQFRDRLVALAETGTAQSLDRPLPISGGAWPEPITHAVVMPLQPGRSHAPVGYLLFGLSPRLPFDKAYAAFVREIADQVASVHSRVIARQLSDLLEHGRNTLLRQAPVAAAVLTGPTHVFQLVNPLYQELVGRRDLIGKSYVEAFPELASTPLPGMLDRVYGTGEPFVTREMLVPLDRDGIGVLEQCYFRFTLEPMRDARGRVYGMMAIAVDITEQVSARQALEQANTAREALLEELQRASQAKDEFLAMLGHELRNPLSPILTALELMRLRGVHGADRERVIIDRQVRHMMRLVDDLLDVSRITRGSIELNRAPVRLADVVSDAIDTANPLIEALRHRLRVDVPAALIVNGDRVRLAQVMANLLTNAAKYTDPGGEIVVTAEAHGAEACVGVRDNGIGIPAEALTHIFELFVQARQTSARSKGGLGLGLAIVKNLVEMHGGQIRVTSDGLHRGTVCSVRLPLASPNEQEETVRPVAAAQSVSRGRHVLLVDDNADAAQTMAEALRALGHRVTVAADAPQALAIAATVVPDVALLDLGLPVVDGYELARRLRAEPGWPDVRLIALTGYGTATDRDRTRAAGFHEHLVKPADLTALDAALRAGDPT